jgi:hypothetical protein
VPAFEIQQVADERTFCIRHIRDLLWQTPVAGGLMISNNFHANRRVAFGPDPEVSFRHLDGVLITSDEPRSVADLLRAEHAFRTLINLLGDCQLEVQEIHANANVAGGPGDVECYDARVAAAFATREDAKVGIAPVSYVDVAADFSAVLQRWFDLHDRLGPIGNLYLLGKQNRYLDLQNIFLGLIQGLERYHRSFHGGVFMLPEQYAADVRPVLYAAIPDELDESLRDRLRSAIRFGYDYSLRRRLRELVLLLPETPTFAEAKNPALVAQTVDTRNCLVHQLEPGNMHVLIGADLHHAINI